MPSSAIGAGAARYSRPLTRIRPAEGSSRPAIIRIVVDLPAPFGPRKPVTTPGRTTKSSPSTASFSPYRLLRFSTSIMRVPVIGTAGNSGTPPTLGITRPARHRPSGHKLNGPYMPQGILAGPQRPTGPARQQAGTQGAGRVPQDPQARVQQDAPARRGPFQQHGLRPAQPRVPAARRREGYAPARGPPGAARTEGGGRPPAPHPGLLAGRHLLAG